MAHAVCSLRHQVVRQYQMTAEHRRFARRPGVLPELRSKKGRATIQMPWPIPSVMSPRARVSDMPSAHLLKLLKLAPPTMIASAIGSAYAAPGFLYWWRAGNPVCSSRAALSTNSSADGVAMIQTRQLRSCARLTSLPMSRAAGVAQVRACVTDETYARDSPSQPSSPAVVGNHPHREQSPASV